jgi:invasion protein IalB
LAYVSDDDTGSNLLAAKERGGERKKAAVSCPAMAFLTRTDPTRNMNRFYVVAVTPTLCGEWAVLREGGRRGSPYPAPRKLSTARGSAVGRAAHDQAPLAAGLREERRQWTVICGAKVR